ncbi:unnamed protein product, partial [Arabidopsis halleri]
HICIQVLHNLDKASITIGSFYPQEARSSGIIFHIWKQRNDFLHNLHSIPPSSIFKCIYRDIKNIITSRRIRRNFLKLIAC